MIDAKIPGTFPGELIRDLSDPRIIQAHSRAAGLGDAAYLAQLEAKGLALSLSRQELAAGAYARTKAKAILSGAVVVVPYEAGEIGAGDASGDGSSAEAFDYMSWRADLERATRAGRSAYERDA